ncbi:MAG: hypothetical protein AB7F43_14195 [Bacteriovoracia bacterium]
MKKQRLISCFTVALLNFSIVSIANAQDDSVHLAFAQSNPTTGEIPEGVLAQNCPVADDKMDARTIQTVSIAKPKNTSPVPAELPSRRSTPEPQVEEQGTPGSTTLSPQ